MPRTPVNHCAKFDAANFILGGEIRNCTNTHTQKNKQRTHTGKTNINRYIHTLGLSACLYNNDDGNDGVCADNCRGSAASLSRRRRATYASSSSSEPKEDSSQKVPSW